MFNDIMSSKAIISASGYLRSQYFKRRSDKTEQKHSCKCVGTGKKKEKKEKNKRAFFVS